MGKLKTYRPFREAVVECGTRHLATCKEQQIMATRPLFNHCWVLGVYQMPQSQGVDMGWFGPWSLTCLSLSLLFFFQGGMENRYKENLNFPHLILNFTPHPLLQEAEEQQQQLGSKIHIFTSLVIRQVFPGPYNDFFGNKPLLDKGEHPLS